MHNLPHPGDFIRTEILEPLGLSVAAAAKALGVSRPTLSTLLNDHSDLSGEMALRLEKAFGGHPHADAERVRYRRSPQEGRPDQGQALYSSRAFARIGGMIQRRYLLPRLRHELPRFRETRYRCDRMTTQSPGIGEMFCLFFALQLNFPPHPGPTERSAASTAAQLLQVATFNSGRQRAA